MVVSVRVLRTSDFINDLDTQLLHNTTPLDTQLLLETLRSLEALRLGIFSFLTAMADLYTAPTVFAVFFTFATVLRSPKFYK